MQRNQGQRQNQFVFDQSQSIEITADDQNILFRLVVKCCRRGLVGHKTERTLSRHSLPHWGQTALALQGQIHRGRHIQPNLIRSARLGLTSALQLPNHRACCQRIAKLFVGQTRPIGQKALPLETDRITGKRQHVQVLGVQFFFHGRSVRESPIRISTGVCALTPTSADTLAHSRPVILGSTSRYRRELLERLRIPFSVTAPNVDETPQASETPRQLALRLALAKAKAVAAAHPQAVVIGSDQVADLAGHPLGKPGEHARAVQQLRQMRGQTVIFQTALAVVCLATGFEQVDLAEVRVVFRDLSDDEIEAYLQAEMPYDCAGSAKSEGLGIALLESIDNDDPTALVGLPLIRTARLLRQAGVKLL